MATATAQKQKSNVLELEVGDHWSRNSYGKVVAVTHDEVVVENEQGTRWALDSALFEAEFTAADQYATVEKVSRTEMVQKIIGSARVAMTIFFRKKPEHKDLVDTVESLLSSNAKAPTRRKLSSLLKDATAGAERTMVGRHYGTTDEFGRIQFLDVIGASSGPGMKTVDPRTVEWAVIENVRYELK